jgi:type VI secretion system protein ImpA
MRSQLRSLYLERRWESLLEATEQIMGSRVGRGWLDLQFYAVHACEALGDPYDDVRSAIVGALRALLADLPSLASSTLMDAMPTATPETNAWIANHIVSPSDAPVEAATRDTPRADHRPGRDVYAAAQLEATSGKPERAIELLMRELARETTERARFLRRIQIASIMVDKGLFGVASPLLAQLIAQIDKFSLADWEDGDVVAQPLILMIRCLDARNDTSPQREEYYLRVCTLSPVNALALTKS